jgi:hypothetical protein
MCVLLRVCACVCACMHVCLYVSMCVCACVSFSYESTCKSALRLGKLVVVRAHTLYSPKARRIPSALEP